MNQESQITSYSKELEQVYADTPEFLKGKIRHKALIVLFGLGNQGKTSTLFDLLFLLTSNSNQIKIHINKYFTKKNRKGQLCYKDGYFVLYYSDNPIFISTCGDGAAECERNKDFFERKPISQPIYIIDGTRVLPLEKLSEEEQNAKYYNVPPQICVSACRTEGGSVDATMYMSKKFLSHILQEVFIRKIGKKGGITESIYPDGPVITKDDHCLALDIKEYIDKMIK